MKKILCFLKLKEMKKIQSLNTMVVKEHLHLAMGNFKIKLIREKTQSLQKENSSLGFIEAVHNW